MSKINKRTQILKIFYDSLNRDKQKHFKAEFERFYNVSESTFFRRIRKGDSLDDAALLEYCLQTKLFDKPYIKAEEFKAKGVTIYQP